MHSSRKRFRAHRSSAVDTPVQSFQDRNSIQARLRELRVELEQVNRMIRVLEWARHKPSGCR